MMSGKALLVAVLLVGVASRCSGSRGLQGDHIAEQKYGGGGYGGGGGGGGGGYTPGYSGTGTCDYWKSHPDAIISCIGSLGSILGSFGDVCSAFFGSKLQTLQDALCNTRTDCYGDLLREGAAAYLNSVAAQKYAYTTQQVKDCIAVALTSEAAAAAQAAMFKKANYACHY
ncbi:hypothetical protein PVAP13_4NG046164 [Panicum virgatum]|uniref:Meiosis 5 n=1 Tax=Panicum virgatum TaxID=38727 RepID=A0A8T0TDE7_PANVG|nr:hypothetical protein PVAP13_4NG046164 [Panicum virgatum]